MWGWTSRWEQMQLSAFSTGHVLHSGKTVPPLYCVCVCMYIPCMHAYMYTLHICVYICISMYVFISCLYICIMYMCMHHLYIYMCMCVYIHICVYTHTHMYHIYAHICIHMYMCVHPTVCEEFDGFSPLSVFLEQVEVSLSIWDEAHDKAVTRTLHTQCLLWSRQHLK